MLFGAPLIAVLAALVAAPADTGSARDRIHIRESQRIIGQYLTDPASAQFRESFIFVARAPVVCGEVRGRRRDGDYGPWRHYFSASYAGLAGVVHAPDEDSADLRGQLPPEPFSAQDWARHCDPRTGRG